MISPILQALIQSVVDSANDEGCSDDLIVAGKAAIEALAAYVEPMSQAAYAENDEWACPYCHAQAVEYSGDVRLNGNKCYHDCNCDECGKAWVEEYTLSGYEGQ